MSYKTKDEYLRDALDLGYKGLNALRWADMECLEDDILEIKSLDDAKKCMREMYIMLKTALPIGEK